MKYTIYILSFFIMSCCKEEPIVVVQPETYELFYSKKYDNQTGQFYEQFNAWLHPETKFELEYIYPDTYTFISNDQS
jgi:hypothetical protein